MKHERLCNGHDYCYPVMPTEDNKILKYNHGEKLLKVLLIIYLDLESLLKKPILAKIIRKSLPQKKILNMKLQAGQ